jgi:hypothetical protein
MVERPQTTMWHMRITCWITRATNTHVWYVILFAFPLQQLLHKRTSVSRCRYMACLITFFGVKNLRKNWIKIVITTVSLGTGKKFSCSSYLVYLRQNICNLVAFFCVFIGSSKKDWKREVHIFIISVN